VTVEPWAVYVRISKARRIDGEVETLGVERQEPPAVALVERLGGTVHRVYVDNDKSAYKGRRPEFEEMLADAKAGVIKGIAAWDVDRLSRDPDKDNERIIGLVERHGVRLATVTGEYDLATSSGRLHYRIAGALARRESEHRSERLKLQREQAANAGRPQTGGRRTFGFTRGRAEVIEAEAAVVRGAADLILRGRSVREATEWANSTGVLTPTGRQWQQVTLRSMLMNAAHAKLREYKGRVVADGTWDAPAILSREQWERLCAILKDPSRLNRPGRPHRWLLSGLAVCSVCSQVLVTHYRPKSRGGGRDYYCLPQPGRPRCGKTTVSAEPLEALVEEQVLQELAEGRLEQVLAAHGGVVTELSQQREVLSVKLREVRELYDSDVYDKQEYLEHRGELTEKLNHVQARLDREYSKTVLSELPTAEARLRDYWADAPLEQKRMILKSVITAVVVGPGSKRGGPRFQSDRVAPPWGIQWRI
jgi:site-specific DNA recombinase